MCDAGGCRAGEECMGLLWSFGRDVRGSIEASVATILCVLLAAPVNPASASIRKRSSSVAIEVRGDERVLHALNRLTFGPRRGEVEAVKEIGLDHWFELQLHPSKIDDSALEARLAIYPAMKLPQADLLRKYP